MSRTRTIPTDWDEGTVARIDARLAAVQARHGVHVFWAIESGSRAWGFPSPDSDYDCRFIFARPLGAYLSVAPPRDVIEEPLEGDLDLNGWDLIKAARLILKGNAVAIEWLRSPFVYEGDPTFQEEWLRFAEAVVDRDDLARHYLYLGRTMLRRYLQDWDAVVLKKVFYALRPAVALRWLRSHPDRVAPPMDFGTLLEEIELPAATRRAIEDLRDRKRITRELGAGAVPAPIVSLITDEFAAALASLRREQSTPDAAHRALADDLVRRWIERVDRSGAPVATSGALAAREA